MALYVSRNIIYFRRLKAEGTCCQEVGQPLTTCQADVILWRIRIELRECNTVNSMHALMSGKD
jgi:hypothetical protein